MRRKTLCGEPLGCSYVVDLACHDGHRKRKQVSNLKFEELCDPSKDAAVRRTVRRVIERRFRGWRIMVEKGTARRANCDGR